MKSIIFTVTFSVIAYASVGLLMNGVKSVNKHNIQIEQAMQQLEVING